ncbi:6-phosphogluconolactonase [Pseudomonadota bacterium]
MGLRSVEKLRTNRISITYPVINGANNVWLFVSGEAKRDIVDKIFNYHTPGRYPAERVNPIGHLTWYLDEAAAYRIDR